MKHLSLIMTLLAILFSASLLHAEDQVQKTNPPSQAEQIAAAQPAPAVYAMAWPQTPDTLSLGAT